MKSIMITACIALLSCSVSLGADAPAKSGKKAAKSGKTTELHLLQRGKVLVDDAFDSNDKAGRRLTRGEWTVQNGVAACTQDDELFKKYNDHGPAIWYDVEFKDVIIEFDFKTSSECQSFVFTVNGEAGHVFRFVMKEAGTDIRAWKADHTGKRLVQDGPALPHEKWTSVTVEIAGDKAFVQIGDDYQVAVEDPSYAVAKNVTGVSFHHGTCQFRNFRVTAGTPK